MSATLDSKTIFWLNWLGLIWMITFFSGSLAMYSKHVYIYIYIFVWIKPKGHRERILCRDSGFRSFQPLEGASRVLWRPWIWGEKRRNGRLVVHWTHLDGGFKYFFYFHPYLGKIPNLTNIFQMGWNHQPDDLGWLLRDFGDFPFLFVCSIYIYIYSNGI